MKFSLSKIKGHAELAALWKEPCSDAEDAKNLDRAILRTHPWLREFIWPLMTLEIAAFTDPDTLVAGSNSEARKIRSELAKCNAVQVKAIKDGVRLREFMFVPEFQLTTQ